MEPTNLEIFVLSILCIPAAWFAVKALWVLFRQTVKYMFRPSGKYGCSDIMKSGFWD